VLKNNGKVVRRREVTKSLSLSVLEGIEESNGDIIVIMDGDGSHPADLIPVFISNIKDGYDLIIGSRYVPGGGTKYFPLSRKIISRFACFLGKIVTRVKDNTSGFICVKKNALKGVNLTPAGFKIGLEIFVKADYHKFKEIPYIFINRRKGESKLKGITVLEYICQIVRLLRYRNSKYRKTCS
jgi:dolichol-phosphate mannosyltransferase